MNRTALVTGSSRGIGRAIALRLAKDGFDVALNDIESNHSDLEKVRQEIETIGRKSIAIIADVSKSEKVEEMMEEVVQKLGSLDVVIANAGICYVKSLLEISADEWDEVFAVNMRGVFLCYREAAKIMIKQGKGGKIIGACSTAGYRGYPMISHYSATKWGVRGLTQAAAQEWARHNITVNAYCPGLIDTRMTQTCNEELAKLRGLTVEENASNSAKNIPIGRTGQPDDVSNVVSFLASKDSDYITGQSILINGGLFFS
ncbi:unnamed protein product [Adineta ricciae]|uniref:diacetyl reductase [(S)-acetoin forming] n=3 Tax=Adineta ricciae TaxID=249248 RepID=A0A816EP22_ADIRI|nr:unnamed protein product [Adineta ricciae]